MCYWHERAAFRLSIAGNDVLATTLISLFFSALRFFPPLLSFLIEGVLGSKNLFSENCLECLGVDTFPGHVGHFGAPWRPFRILQAVSECPLLRLAGIFIDCYETPCI